MVEVVRVQNINGGWETLGLVTDPLVTPESIAASANEWGPDQLTCTLQRDPTEIAVDLSTWTPCELEVDGIIVWDGRVKEVPKQGGATPSLNLVGEGWQYHLDDDLFQTAYLSAAQSEFVDMRSPLNADLTKLIQAGTVSNDDLGAIAIGLPAGTVVVVGNYVGVMLDMGPVARAARWQIWPFGTGTANFSVFMRGSDNDDPLNGIAGTYEDIASPTLAAVAAPMGGTFVTPRRYVSVFLAPTAGATLANDVWLKITATVVATDTAYMPAAVSTLTADKVIADALNKATVLLSADRSQIATTSFAIPSLDFRNTPRTPRDVWGDVNALHNYKAKILVGRVPYFQPQATSPFAVIRTSDLGVDWNDASSGSGDSIVNRVIVTGQSGSGVPLRTDMSAAQLPTVPYLAAPGVSVPNPSATVNTTGWAASMGTLSRTTTAGEFNSAPAAFKLLPVLGAGGFRTAIMDGALSGTFLPGIWYVILALYKSAAAASHSIGCLLLDSGYHTLAQTASSTPVGTWSQVGVGFMPTTPVVNPILRLYFTHQEGATIAVFFDDVAINTGQPTLADRRGFKRTQVLSVGSVTDPATMNQLATLYLQAHSETPFKGSCSISSPTAAVDPRSGRVIPPHEFIGATQELIRFGDLPDPDTGGMGRDGIIRTASYQNGSVQLSVDNTNTNLEALMARMAVVQGG